MLKNSNTAPRFSVGERVGMYIIQKLDDNDGLEGIYYFENGVPTAEWNGKWYYNVVLPEDEDEISEEITEGTLEIIEYEYENDVREETYDDVSQLPTRRNPKIEGNLLIECPKYKIGENNTNSRIIAWNPIYFNNNNSILYRDGVGRIVACLDFTSSEWVYMTTIYDKSAKYSRHWDDYTDEVEMEECDFSVDFDDLVSDVVPKCNPELQPLSFRNILDSLCDIVLHEDLNEYITTRMGLEADCLRLYIEQDLRMDTYISSGQILVAIDLDDNDVLELYLNKPTWYDLISAVVRRLEEEERLSKNHRIHDNDFDFGRVFLIHKILPMIRHEDLFVVAVSASIESGNNFDKITTMIKNKLVKGGYLTRVNEKELILGHKSPEWYIETYVKASDEIVKVAEQVRKEFWKLVDPSGLEVVGEPLDMAFRVALYSAVYQTHNNKSTSLDLLISLLGPETAEIIGEAINNF